jgi:hypothetical protein
MAQLSKKRIEQYLRRSYTAVDGLWFMKVEEKFGFETSLEIDQEVWKVMAKIQSRALKAILAGPAGDPPNLRKAFSAKLKLDGFKFGTRTSNSGFTVTIPTCPWLEILAKAGRQEFADRIGSAICGSEYPVWPHEFGDSYSLEFISRICKGDKICRIDFIKN